MPYDGPGDPSLPKNVKKLSTKKKAQWVHVFNGEMAKHHDEGLAFAAANGVAKKDLIEDWYDVDSRQVPQDQAGYNSVGMNGEMACANCHWFVSPNSCLLVSGDISPTGLSKLWMKPVASTSAPMEVTIVKPATTDDSGVSMPLMGKSNEGNIFEAVVKGMKSLFNPSITDTSDSFGDGPIRFYKANGTPLRFVATVSNNFRDREAEIITEEAHKEYVDWATNSGNYPELWLWHLGSKSRWGMVDWLDVSDGFLVASGIVDPGKEHIAKAVAKDGKDVGISHGFYKHLVNKDAKTVDKYRSFEISPLPMWAAANEWTSYDLLNIGEDLMPFSDEKRKWLADKGMKQEEIKSFEEGLSSFAKELKARGIDFKDFAPPEPATATATVVTPPVTTETVVKEEVKAAAAVDTTAVSNKALTDRIDTLEASIKSLTETFTATVEKLSKSQDDKVVDLFKAATDKLPKGFQASESAGNTPETDAAAKELAERDKKQKENGWWNEIVMGGLKV